MRRIGLVMADSANLCVTEANGDRLPCEGVARNVPIRINLEDFSITCFGINLGCFNFILSVDYLRTLGPILWDFESHTLSFWRVTAASSGGAWADTVSSPTTGLLPLCPTQSW
jgi:hypothetical protein